MRKVIFVCLSLLVASPALAQCTKIQSGQITAKDGVTVLTTGYDKWGYNYQAHMFNGLYGNFVRPTPVVAEGAVNLIMKWSDDWLSNQDCNGDLRLDRGGAAGANANISKGWLTNHIEGDCTNQETNELEHYTYFVKIVYDGGSACSDSSNTACIWGSYAIIEEVSNNAPPAGGPDDPNAPFVCGGTKGGDRSKLVNPAGLGFYTNGGN